MELPFDPERRQEAVAFVSECLGPRLGSQASYLGNDELEELVFRLHCGENGDWILF